MGIWQSLPESPVKCLNPGIRIIAGLIIVGEGII